MHFGVIRPPIQGYAFLIPVAVSLRTLWCLAFYPIESVGLTHQGQIYQLGLAATLSEVMSTVLPISVHSGNGQYGAVVQSSIISALLP